MPWFSALRALADLPSQEQAQAFVEDPSLVAYVHTALYEVERLQERLDAMVPLVAALAVYGADVNIAALVEKARALNTIETSATWAAYSKAPRAENGHPRRDA